MTYGALLFDPLIPWPVLALLFGLVALSIALALWRGLSGWALRALAALVVLGALAGPVYQTEERDPLNDIVLLVEDQSASQTLSDRVEQTSQAADAMVRALQARGDTDLRHVRVGDAEGDSGTTLMTALAAALAEEPRARVAGIIALSDGQIHDMERLPDLPAPLHLLRTGHSTDWDRRLVVLNAPSFAIIGEPFALTLRVEDQGAAPADTAQATVNLSLDG